jgi:hypothetical protein
LPSGGAMRPAAIGPHARLRLIAAFAGPLVNGLPHPGEQTTRSGSSRTRRIDPYEDGPAPVRVFSRFPTENRYPLFLETL